jgi:transaldolase
MKLYLDSADINEVRCWQPVISGVTTNPTFLPTAERIARLSEICKVMPANCISVELVALNDADMLAEAAHLYSKFPGLVLKVSALNPGGGDNLAVIRALSDSGYSVNATICMSFNQLMLATLAGADYVSLFWGRVADEGGDPSQIVDAFVRWNDYDTELIVGSIRGPADVQAAAIAGADIITATQPVLAKAVRHWYSQETSRQFYKAGNP